MSKKLCNYCNKCGQFDFLGDRCWDIIHNYGSMGWECKHNSCIIVFKHIATQKIIKCQCKKTIDWLYISWGRFINTLNINHKEFPLYINCNF